MKSMDFLQDLLNLQVCHQHGNRIVFRSGHNLTQLASRMAEVLDERFQRDGFDSARLSRLIHGEAPFTARQWEVFCELLKIKEEERSILEGILTDHLAISRGLQREPANSYDFQGRLQRYGESISEMKVMWLGGIPQRAIDVGDLQIERLVKDLKRYTSVRQRQSLLMLQSELVYFRGRAYACSLHPQQASSLLDKVAGEQARIASALKAAGLRDNSALARACHARGDARYLLEDWKTARSFYTQGLEIETDPTMQFEFIRLLGLVSAYIQDGRAFGQRVKEMKKSLEKGQFGSDAESLLLEVETRGYVLFKNRAARNTMDKGFAIISIAQSKGEPMVLRRLQFHRDEILEMMFLQGGSTEELGRELSGAMRIAREHTYQKYSNEFERLTREYVQVHPRSSSLMEILVNDGDLAKPYSSQSAA